MRSAPFRAALFVSAFFFTLPGLLFISGQSRTNSSGTGGIHEIRGKIYLPNGKTVDSPVEVELQSISNFSSLKVMTDREGVYSFRNLQAGNYTVIVRAGDQFEEAREYTTIDTEASGRSTSPIPPTPKVVTIPVYLALKKSVILRNEVINAKWSSIPKEAVDHLRRGAESLQEGKPTDAEAEFRKAVEIAPNFAPAHTELAKLAFKSGKPEVAIEECRTAIRYDESDFDAHLNLGMAYMSLNKIDLAEPEFVTAAYIDRTAITPHYYLGILYVMKDDLNIAQKAFETARDLNGGNGLPAIHRFLGRIYIRKDMEKEGLHELETYVKLAPKAQDAEKVRKEIADIKAKHKNAFV